MKESIPSRQVAKDFNAMLRQSRDMPKIERIQDRATIERYGGEKMLLAPPLAYDELMRRVPEGKLLTVGQMREHLADRYGADFTCPLTAGIFVNIAAWASWQREADKTPYWRTLKTDGALNEKYPGGIAARKAMLEKEGHTVVEKGRTKLRYFVKDYAAALIRL